MTSQTVLDSKECRCLIARALGIPVGQVIPLRYSFAVQGVPLAELQRKLDTIVDHSKDVGVV